jgi:hypothetical protein
MGRSNLGNIVCRDKPRKACGVNTAGRDPGCEARRGPESDRH